MKPQLGLQLYSVRDVIARRSYADVVREIATMGYAVVEPAGFPGSTAQEAAKLFKELGLSAPSGHFAMPLGEKKNEVIEAAKTIGCQYLVSGKGPDDFKTPELIKKTCDLFNRAAAAASENGLKFAIHNHWWEFESVNGQPVYKEMLKHLQSNVLFQIDTYWVKVGGADPAAVLEEVGARAPLLHIKDGPGVKGQPHLAVGDGVMDFQSIAKASASTANLWIVELDSCATDMMEAVRKSAAYLTSQGLAQGKR